MKQGCQFLFFRPRTYGKRGHGHGEITWRLVRLNTDVNFLSPSLIGWGLPGEEFALIANSLGAHMKVIESPPSMGHDELILRTFI